MKNIKTVRQGHLNDQRETVTLREIFTSRPNQHFYEKKDLIELELKPQFLNLMTMSLDLSYLECDSSMGNVCFANNSEVRSEFRTVFNKRDLVRYIGSSLTKSIFVLSEEVPFPKDGTSFWGVGKKNNN